MVTVFFIFLLSTIGMALADNPDDSEIYTVVVEAHRDYEVYVADTKITNSSNYNIEDISFNFDLFYSYISSFRLNAKSKDENGIFVPISMTDNKINIYNEDTIEYVWENCSYKVDHRKCSVKNSHYFVESNLIISNKEIIFNVVMYDQDLQLVSRGSSTSKIKVEYVPNVTYEENQQQPQVTNNCFGGICSMPSNNQNETKKTEYEKVTIKPSLYSSNIYQASLGLWLGVKLQ